MDMDNGIDNDTADVYVNDFAFAFIIDLWLRILDWWTWTLDLDRCP